MGECTSTTDRSSICKGSDLPLGATCFDATQGSLGTCASPNICLDNVCTAPSTSCIQPVNGLCYQKETGQTIGSCCTTADGAATTSVCLPFPVMSPDPDGDYFCQKGLAVGDNCDESEHRGFCLYQWYLCRCYCNHHHQYHHHNHHHHYHYHHSDCCMCSFRCSMHNLC